VWRGKTELCARTRRQTETVAPNRALLRNVARMDNRIGRNVGVVGGKHADLPKVAQECMSETRSQILASAEFTGTDNSDRNMGANDKGVRETRGPGLPKGR